jgi:hypothetical protein
LDGEDVRRVDDAQRIVVPLAESGSPSWIDQVAPPSVVLRMKPPVWLCWPPVIQPTSADANATSSRTTSAG